MHLEVCWIRKADVKTNNPDLSLRSSASVLERQLRNYDYRLVPGASWMSRAAVAAVLRPQGTETELLFIRRSDNPRDPWSGHMAFPGGRAESDEKDTRITAERETWEELGFHLSESARLNGRMSDILATAKGRHLPLVITPWIYSVEEPPLIQPNHEVAEALWVPMSFFRDPKNRSHFDYRFAGISLRLPCYHYEGRKIWGLTLKMVDELLDVEMRAQAAARETFLRSRRSF